MKLFKVTYEQVCSPINGFYKETKEGYYFSNSLDRLYNYMENELSLTVISINIIPHTKVPSLDIAAPSTLKKEYRNTEQIVRAM